LKVRRFIDRESRFVPLHEVRQGDSRMQRSAVVKNFVAVARRLAQMAGEKQK
jgi:hypothetical protein